MGKLSKQERERLIAAYKKANVNRRKRIVAIAGYDSEETYLNFLGGKKQNKKKKETKNKPTVHSVMIVDCSYSMTTDNKIKTAKEGLNAEINSVNKDKSVNYTMSITLFGVSERESDYKCDGYSGTKHDLFLAKTGSIKPRRINAVGNTPLYDAIGFTIEKLKKHVKSDDKVVINILTDGGENTSRVFSASSISKLIKEQQDAGWVITFIGTSRDVAFVISKLKIDSSNTLVHDNTSKGVEETMSFHTQSRQAYSKTVLQGTDTNTQFYSKTIL